jgi:preprotein translocase subunit SecF
MVGGGGGVIFDITVWVAVGMGVGVLLGIYISPLSIVVTSPQPEMEINTKNRDTI